nr:IclR family transcriptional regulator [Microcella alkaliphila]
MIEVLSTEGPLTPGEIADRVQMPRPSVYRLLDGLNAIGLTESLPDSTARLSLRWLHLADNARASMREWSGAHSVLLDLVERTGQTAYLSVLRNDEAVCLEWEQGRGIGVLVLKPGRSLPLNAGAAGRTLLAFGADVDTFLASSPRTRFTAKTLTSGEELRADVDKTRGRGYVISDEDVTEGIAALGVPVKGRAGTIAGALSLAGLASEIRTKQDALVGELRRAAEALETTAARV